MMVKSGALNADPDEPGSTSALCPTGSKDLKDEVLQLLGQIEHLLLPMDHCAPDIYGRYEDDMRI